MIQASKTLKDFIEAQNSIEDFAGKLKVTRQTIYNIIKGENISSDMVAKILNETGMDFEKAFSIENE